MIIHNPVITGSLQINGTSVSSIDQVDNISGSVVTLTEASASLASRVTGAEGSVNSLNAASSSYLLNTTDTLDGDLTVTGKITAQEFHTEFVSASIIYESGSTQFGNSSDDTHIFTGKVGVGTATPTPNADTAYNNIQIGESAILSGYNSGASLLAIGENFYWNSGWKYLTSAPASTHQMNTGTHSFRVASSGTAGGSLTWISALDIDNSGNVGIGTSTPTAPLDVRRGDTDGIVAEFHNSTGYGIDVGSSTSDAYISSGYLQNFIFKTNSGSGQTERLRIDSSGNVGIGTSSPATKLNIRTDASDDGILLEKTDGTDIARLFYDGSSTNGRLDMFSGGIAKVQIHTNGTSHFSGGNVGIGTSSPATGRNLHIAGSSTAITRIEATATSGEPTLELYGKNSSGTQRTLVFKYDNADLFRIGTSQAVDIRFETNDVERMRITNTGSIGIGTNSPVAKLDVLGTFAISNSAFSSWIFDRNDIDGSLTISDSASERLRIDTSGNVGIGTSSPNTKLHITGGLRQETISSAVAMLPYTQFSYYNTNLADDHTAIDIALGTFTYFTCVIEIVVSIGDTLETAATLWVDSRETTVTSSSFGGINSTNIVAVNGKTGTDGKFNICCNSQNGSSYLAVRNRMGGTRRVYMTVRIISTR